MGSYNASTGVWTKGADYSLTKTGMNSYAVTGEIPYGSADSIFPTAGNRFAVRIYNRDVGSTASLPSGTIVKTTHTEKAGGYNTGTKADFESDGSLIAIFEIKPDTKDAYDREVKIAWSKAGANVTNADFTTYTFDLSGATLESGVV